MGVQCCVLGKADARRKSPHQTPNTHHPTPNTQYPTPNTQPLVLWLEGRSREQEMAASYWPFIDLLCGYFGWTPGASPHDWGARRPEGALDRGSGESLNPRAAIMAALDA